MNEFKKNIFKKRTESTVLSLIPSGISISFVSNTICGVSALSVVFTKTNTFNSLTNGDIVYITNDESSPFLGTSGEFYKLIVSHITGAVSYVVEISIDGEVTVISTCP